MSDCPSILVLGAGELGLSVLESLSSHPRLSNRESQSLINIAVLCRSIEPNTPAKQSQLSRIYSLGIPISTITADIYSATIADLITVFKQYHTVISCTGFSAPSGTQLKIARAVLGAGVKRYLPWQFGLDYDAIGRGSGQNLFDEQIDVRDLLRSQQGQEVGTEWVIVSTGLFISFLFENGFVVDVADSERRAAVTALGAWDNKVTVTDVEDIGKIVADVVLGERETDARNQVVYAGGETITYERLAEVVEEELGTEVKREVRTVPALEEMLRRSPEDGMVKYKLVFARGVGASWDVERTWNRRSRVSVVDVREWMRKRMARSR